MDTTKDSSQSEKKKTASKAYSSPQLVEYGNIQQLTNSAGGASKNADGGSGKGTNKTA